MSLPLDPVAAYNRIAPIYADLAEQRRAYLDAIERLIIDNILPGSRSLLDVGGGDGSRALRIAQSRGIAKLVLLEPAAAMQSRLPPDVQVWTLRAEDLDRTEGEFDVILCLWNVLGHIFPAPKRLEVLRQIARLLIPGGKAFIDVNHRYNARHYGLLITAMRYLRDRLAWHATNGDVPVTWRIGELMCTTMGHVFTDKEVRSLCREAGLNIESRFVVDYATGETRRSEFEGHLLYVLAPRTAS